MRLTELVGSSGSSANDWEEIRFAKDSPVEGSGFEPSVPRKLPTTGIAPQSSRGSITSRSGNPTTNPAALVAILDQDRRTGCPADRLPTARAADRSGTASRNRGRESRPAGPCWRSVRVIEGRRNADAVEFPDADSDLHDRVVVPELRIAAAGHRFRPL